MVYLSAVLLPHKSQSAKAEQKVAEKTARKKQLVPFSVDDTYITLVNSSRPGD